PPGSSHSGPERRRKPGRDLAARRGSALGAVRAIGVNSHCQTGTGSVTVTGEALVSECKSPEPRTFGTGCPGRH
ncbi:MAG TPA: hypothetical protein VIK08_02800, partial [Candidatus Limnocylindrales bacterium]